MTTKDRNYCWCCCCQCCHVKTACIIIGVLQLLGGALAAFDAGVQLTHGQEGAMLGIQVVLLIYAMFLVIAVVLLFVATSKVKPELVVPIASMQAFGVIAGILRIAFISYLAAAHSSAAQEMLEDEINGGWLFVNGTQPPDVQATVSRTVTVVTGLGVGLTILANLIGIAFCVWFLILFLQLKAYLTEKKIEEGTKSMALTNERQPPYGTQD